MINSKKQFSYGVVLAIISFQVMLGQATYTMYLPGLPNIQDSLHTSETYVQYTLSLYILGFALSQLLYGPLSDLYSKKKILLTSISIFLIATLMAIMSDTIHSLIIARLIQGIGAGAFASIGRNTIASHFETTQTTRALSLLAISSSLTAMLAPVLGAYLIAHISWHTIFTVLLTLGIIQFILVLIYYPSFESQYKDKVSLSGLYRPLFEVMKIRVFRSGAVICFVVMFSLAGFMSLAPFLFITHFKLSTIEFGWLSAATAFFYGLGALNSDRITKLIQLEKLTVAVIVMLAVMMVIIAILKWQQLPIIMLIGFIFSAGIGSLYPSAMHRALSVEKNKGAASALVGSIQMLGAALGVFLVSGNTATPINDLAILIFSSLLLFGGTKCLQARVLN